jgi:hypothetical protein
LGVAGIKTSSASPAAVTLKQFWHPALVARWSFQYRRFGAKTGHDRFSGHVIGGPAKQPFIGCR